MLCIRVKNADYNVRCKFFFFLVNSVFQDGTIDKNDLRGAFDNVGVLMTESELDELLGEVRKTTFIFCSDNIFPGVRALHL